MEAIWTPQPKQAEFMSRAEDEVLYGGAAGGGKSDALVIEALRQIHIPHYKGLILRKTFPELTDLIEKSHFYYRRLPERPIYNTSSHTWRFPSGAQIIFGSMQHEKDKHKYQGKAYDYIAFDELTHFTKTEYEYLKSRNRATGPGTREYIRATANPGGIGHGWVKERFITAAIPGQTIWEKVNVEVNGYKVNGWKSRVFIPSNVFDNQKLLDNDPDYLIRLASLPETERKALLYGDWDSFSGQYFTEWRNNPEHYRDRKWTHVIEPFDIPGHWPIYRCYDYGYAKPFAVTWYAISDDGILYQIAELYGCTGEPDVGIRWNTDEQFSEIARIEREHPYFRGKKIRGIADPAIWAENGGISTIDTAEKYHVYFNKGDNQRIPGWQQVRYRMQFDDNGYCRYYVFNTCKHTIRTIPVLIHSERIVEDLDTTGEDHIADTLRYMCNAHTVKPIIKKPKERIIYDDPLDMFKKY